MTAAVFRVVRGGREQEETSDLIIATIILSADAVGIIIGPTPG